MCGGGGDQTVTQRTEIDPELRRLLYGGALTSARGLRDPNAALSMRGGGHGGPSGSGGMYAMGGPVQSGIASMQPNTPMTQNMPMMNGRLPNLSDPEIAATLAMAQMRPQMMMGMGSGGMPQQPFAMGGLVGGLASSIARSHDSVPFALSGRLGDHIATSDVRGPTSLFNRGVQQPVAQPEPRDNSEELVRQLVAQGRANYFPDTPAGAGMPQLPTLEMGGRPLQFAMGGYVEGPGTGTSDDIPATIYQDGMPVQNAALSDGEFVMTERAVRNAGGGDRDRGAARMYEMMRMFEQGGRV